MDVKIHYLSNVVAVFSGSEFQGIYSVMTDENSMKNAQLYGIFFSHDTIKTLYH